MFDRFVRIRDQMIDVSESEGDDLSLNISSSSLNKATRFTKSLHDVNFVTKSIQKRGYKLSESRDDLDTLINYIYENVENRDSYFYHGSCNSILEKHSLCLILRLFKIQILDKEL